MERSCQAPRVVCVASDHITLYSIVRFSMHAPKRSIACLTVVCGWHDYHRSGFARSVYQVAVYSNSSGLKARAYVVKRLNSCCRVMPAVSRFNFPDDAVELYAERVAKRGLCAQTQVQCSSTAVERDRMSAFCEVNDRSL